MFVLLLKILVNCNNNYWAGAQQLLKSTNRRGHSEDWSEDGFQLLKVNDIVKWEPVYFMLPSWYFYDTLVIKRSALSDIDPLKCQYINSRLYQFPGQPEKSTEYWASGGIELLVLYFYLGCFP